MKISILSAVWNESAHIQEMVSSIQSQDHQDWEIVFVDDASTDQTAALIEEMAADDPRILLASRGVKLGVAGAFNAAYAASSGDLICLLAGDDRLAPGALRLRAREHPKTERPAVSFYKLRTFSTDPRYDGQVLPKGKACSRSGASITMNRALADLIFPIPPDLAAEDIYMAAIIDDVAEVRKEVPRVVMEYRIHEHNSNPRRAPFREMTEKMHRFNAAYDKILGMDRLRLSDAGRERITALAEAERLRYRGRWLAVLLRPKLPLVDRLAYASMANPLLYRIRQRFFRIFSGHRGG